MKIRKLLAVLPLLILAGCSIPVGTSEGSQSSSQGSNRYSTATVEQAADKLTADTIPGEGEFLTPEDVGIGTYKSAGADGSFSVGCYRSTYADRERDKVITTASGDGPAIIEITSKTKLVKTDGCLPFKKVG